MQLLAVSAPLHRFHHQVLGCKEGHILPQSLVDHLLVHPQAACNVPYQTQDRVRTQECFRQGDAAVG